MKGKQKRYLRSLAVNEQPIFQIGKGGVNENLIIQLNDALEARELIKIHVLENSAYTAKEVGEILARETNSECVSVIGSKVTLFKQKAKDSKFDLKNLTKL